MSLERFTDAQERVWPVPLEEIRRGRKDSHWMWFVFPQLKGLGRSATALHYGIADRPEAEAYLADPVLGPRLVEISRAMLSHADTAPETILGPVDALKLRSSATLFEAVGGDPVFAQMIEAFFDGQRCEKTLDLLS
ncbi:calpastatin [Roseovarius sp. HI0049]|nr:calpastatin [Roseovarius sp. HI0049]KZY48708.1 calpastatin [Roseovarius sp. HI0049]